MIETIEAAPAELTDLAVAMRPGWDREELSLALVAARNAGWSWKRTLLATAQLLCDPKGAPHHLKAAAARPFDRREGDEPPDTYRQLREEVDRRHAS